MSEDDTYRILTRKTIQEMALLIARSKPSEILTVLAENGWTYDEYFAAVQEQSKNKLAAVVPEPVKKEKFRVYDSFGSRPERDWH